MIEAPQSFSFSDSSPTNTVTLRQTFGIYPNFIQAIACDLEQVCQRYHVCAILYQMDATMISNFPNGVRKTITYHVYYTALDDCRIDNVFYDELLGHLTGTLRMSPYVSQVFLQSLRLGFNKPDARVDNLIERYGLHTQHDVLDEIRQLVLNLTQEQRRRIETIVAKNATFNAILPNMLLLNVTNCIQQESLSIKYADTQDQKTLLDLGCDVSTSSTIDDDIEDNDDADDDDNAIEIGDIAAADNSSSNDQKFKRFMPEIDFNQHYYYCSYGGRSVVVVEANIQLGVFNTLILKNLIAFFLVLTMEVDQLHIVLYIEKSRFQQFSKTRILGKILQYRIRNSSFELSDELRIDYDIDMNVPRLYGTAPLVVANTRYIKDSFKSKIKATQMYLIVCGRALRRFMTDWSCICKILRILMSPYDGNTFYHVLVYIHDADVHFLYDYLPKHGLDGEPCRCSNADKARDLATLPHAQKLWLLRPCVELQFHTHFDWTILKISNDFARRPDAKNLFQLYDVFESGKLKIARLLDTKVFKSSIENLATYKFFSETGLLYPFQHEELYALTLVKMYRVVYRCILLPLTKLDKVTAKSLLPSKYQLTSAFIDDPLTPTTSVRGPQSARNLKSVENSDKMFDTKVINVTMLMNSYNLCGSESIENSIKM